MPKNSRSYESNDSRPRGRDSSRRDSGRSRRGRERRLSVRSELRDQPDVHKIARAVIAMAMAQAEAEAAAQAETEQADKTTPAPEQVEASDAD